jgi:hypothetical protein
MGAKPQLICTIFAVERNPSRSAFRSFAACHAQVSDRNRQRPFNDLGPTTYQPRRVVVSMPDVVAAGERHARVSVQLRELVLLAVLGAWFGVLTRRA